MGVPYLALVIFATQYILTDAGDPVVYFPPFELRAVSGESTPFLYPVADSPVPIRQLQSQSPQHEKHHTSNQHLALPVRQTFEVSPPQHKYQEVKNSSINVQALLQALGVEDSKEQTEDQEEFRAATREYGSAYPYQPFQQLAYGYEHQPFSYAPQYPSYGSPSLSSYPSSQPSSYKEPVHETYASPSNHESSVAYSPAKNHESSLAYLPPFIDQHQHHKSPKTLSLLSDTFVKPVANTLATKASGLIGLVLSLLGGSSSGDLQLNGLLGTVINGIIKPLLVAKGGIKTLISKLSIPLISLLLINLEVLITIWWLWEECPQPQIQSHSTYQSPLSYQPPSSYQQPPTYQYSKPVYSSSYK